MLFNSGIREVTIPQLIISYYDEDKHIIWVDHKYLPEGIRPQRKLYFEYDFLSLSEIKIINHSMENVFVNGLSNKEISKKIIPQRKTEHNDIQLLPVKEKTYKYVKIELNNYIGDNK